MKRALTLGNMANALSVNNMFVALVRLAMGICCCSCLSDMEREAEVVCDTAFPMRPRSAQRLQTKNYSFTNCQSEVWQRWVALSWLTWTESAFSIPSHALRQYRHKCI